MPKTVVITGASTGIGFALAEALGAKGWQVIAGARTDADRARLDDLPGVESIDLDVTVYPHQRALAERFAATGLDCLINNAGVAGGGPWETVPMDQLRNSFEVNFFWSCGDDPGSFASYSAQTWQNN